ncbi:MAG TPA: bifunctional demethylmenaquinone methyltransferase/2-methoxy-6-polyprenyl-1,4-benzoquinol methylase UbiE [Bacteroidota bacterium]
MSRKDTSSRRTYRPEYVRTMFNRIAPRYDLLNHLLSSGIDIFWRRKAIRILQPLAPMEILDVATGTGDFAFEAADLLHPRSVVGVDVAEEMIRIGEVKAKKRGLDNVVRFAEGQAESLPFSDSSFDSVISAFGVRNFSDLNKGLREFSRVLRPGGSVVILEFSNPRAFPVRQLYRFYSDTVLPAVGRLISRNREAYEYLPGTIREFPDGDDFLSILKSAGLESPLQIRLTFGIVTIYHAHKPIRIR